MKKGSTNSRVRNGDEPRKEYDFRGGVRGKHHKAYSEGHSVVIHKTDGSTVIQQYKIEEGAVILDRDVRDYFPTSEAVNNALRTLIALIPVRSVKPRKPRAKPQRKHNT